MTEQLATNVIWHDHTVTKDERAKLNGHQGAVLWFTGLSACGKSTVANTVDHLLHSMGKHSFVLDGDNIRMGLNKNLKFSAEDRAENIRRIGEVAKLFAHAGNFTLTAFISPYRADRDKVRALLGPGEFIEIYVERLAGNVRKARSRRACTRRPAPAKSRASPASTIRMKPRKNRNWFSIPTKRASTNWPRKWWPTWRKTDT